MDAEIARLAVIEAGASSGLMRLITRFGTSLEGSLGRLPAEQRKAIEKAVVGGLELSYRLAANSHGGEANDPGERDNRHRLAAMATGAAGGFGGLPATVVELPATITVMFRAVQAVARAHGEDMTDAETRIACLKVFGSGGPSKDDDGVETAFVAARLGAVQSLGPVVSMVAPRLAALLGQKVAAQAVPVVGAANRGNDQLCLHGLLREDGTSAFRIAPAHAAGGPSKGAPGLGSARRGSQNVTPRLCPNRACRAAR